jgi:uncharacterized membrane protein
MRQSFLAIIVSIDPALVHLGPAVIRWYSLFFLLAIVAGVWLALREQGEVPSDGKLDFGYQASLSRARCSSNKKREEMFTHHKHALKPDEKNHSWPNPQPNEWPQIIPILLILTTSVTALDMFLPGLPASLGGPVGRLTTLLSGICAQRLSHSYTLGGVPLPLEARMTGIFVGLAVGIIVLTTIGRSRLQGWPRFPLALTLALGFGVMVFDGFNALLFDLGWPHAYAPDLRLRLASGMLAGMAAAFVLVPLLTQLVYGGAHVSATASPQWRDAGWTLLGSGLFALLVASGWRLMLYPVALISAAGVILAFAVVNWAVLAVLLRPPSAAGMRRRYLWGTSAGAIGLAVAELALLAALRLVFGA